MPRKYFDQKLADLNRSMKEMGAVVDRRIGETMEALKNLDKDLAAEVVGGDREINQVEHEIESVCMNLLALQQPIATDLRVIASCLKIITDVERVADQCADICDIIQAGEIPAQSSVVNHVVQMLETAGAMFEKAMDAFIARDVALARQVCGTITENPQSVMKEVDLMFITKYIERMGDHATNIAEWVVYMETGVHPDLNDGRI